MMGQRWRRGKDAERPATRLTRRWTVRLAVLSVGVLLTAAGPLVGSASADSTDDSAASLTVSPPSVAAGSTTSFDATVTNLGTATMSDAVVTVPTGYTIVGTPTTTPTANVAVSGNVVEVTGFGVGNNQSITVHITATAPCGTETPGSSGWQAQLTDNDSDEGAPGTATNQLTGTCSLAFSPTHQPADAFVNTAITNTAYNSPAGGPVTVEELDGNGQVMTGSTVPVTVTIGSNPSGGTLAGTTMQSAVSGVASFSDLSINLPGTYDLSAQAGGFAPATSNSFVVSPPGTVCTAGQQCTATAGVPGEITTQVTTTPDNNSVLSVTLSSGGVSCGDPFNHAPLVTTVTSTDVTATGTKTAVVHIDAAYVGNKFPFSYQICYQSPTPFRDILGRQVTTGLLPSCFFTRGSAPCVVSIVKSRLGCYFLLPPFGGLTAQCLESWRTSGASAGDIVETIRLPGADPRFF